MGELIVTSKTKNPCVGCGACCAFFRVSFHWLETQSAGGTVPDEDTVAINQPHLIAMKGTDAAKDPRCVNLVGTIGKDSQCSKYETRSSSCRDFDGSYQFGIKEPRCDRARAKHGLRELTPTDWI